MAQQHGRHSTLGYETKCGCSECMEAKHARSTFRPGTRVADARDLAASVRQLVASMRLAATQQRMHVVVNSAHATVQRLAARA